MYFLPLWIKVNKLIVINTLKEIGMILRGFRKETKYLISLKTVASIVPTANSFDNDNTITNLFDIAKNVNSYFASIAETATKHNILTKTFYRVFYGWKW